MNKFLLIASLIFSIQQPVNLDNDIQKVILELENQRTILEEISPIESIEEIKKLKEKIDIQEFIVSVAKQHNVDPQLALFIVRRESNFNPNVIGDGDKVCKRTGKPIRSRGLFQINDCVWPEISDEEAFSVVSSTIWAMPKLKEKPKIWSTYKFCKLWYEDCPL